MSNRSYPWGHSKPFNDYATYIKQRFSERVQKISVDAGFTCPNRDGTVASGGCTYCDNDTFKPFYCSSKKSVTQQLNEGIDFFAKKYKSQNYSAYFQSFSNTYAPLEHLKRLYSEALNVEGVTGLVIGTRPDCIDEAKLDYLQQLAENHYIVLEYGLESCHNDTLRKINRGHSFEESVKALDRSKNRGFDVGVHLIMGLPGEPRELLLEEADILSELPFDMLKLHQLQIVKRTPMAKDYSRHPENFQLFSTADEYINFLVSFINRLNPEIKIERFVSQSPPDMLIAPNWGGLKNFEFVHKLLKALKDTDSFQGKYYMSSV
ncbi:MAG: TIGR01212 family radical SAM protein [Bacteroidota bacterium]|nr:TIGR01212 family radical SAM protein [Bacteroidota bacterium]